LVGTDGVVASTGNDLGSILRGITVIIFTSSLTSVSFTSYLMVVTGSIFPVCSQGVIRPVVGSKVNPGFSTAKIWCVVGCTG